MKKFMVKVCALCLVLLNFMPLTALAAESSKAPEKPYEKVVAKSGRWYAEQLAYSGKTNLVVGYTGSYESNETERITFEIREKIVLSGIYIPILGNPSESIHLSLTDDKGNIYKGFSVEMQKTGEIKEGDESGSFSENTTCIFVPDGDIALSKGHYILSVEGTKGLIGAFLVKGVNFGAYEKYRQALLASGLKNNQEKNAEEIAGQSFGTESLSGDEELEYNYGDIATAVTPVFALDAEYQIDEIIVSTYNDGKGASPGTISILDESGRTIYSGQSYGVSIENIANGAWKIAPGILLPADNYSIILSQPEVLSYDETGEPLFYVKASIPVLVREDFTGTYKIDLDAYKTSTLMGAVSEKSSSFSLKDFELTVLDKGEEIELIGQYEGMPFSQNCEIVEETAEKIIAKFDFAADLTKLPYKAKIIVNAIVTLDMSGRKAAKISMDGTCIYDRAASAKIGSDHNTYELKAGGTMSQRELPPFVMTALGKASGAGNIPGPDNATQAAAGILFPPLVGVMVNVLQELLKPKVAAKGVLRDKSWYKKKYPNLSNEQIAAVMLGDAMGNTDNPDEGDVISVGDNESNVSNRSSSGEDYAEEDYAEEDYAEEDYAEEDYEGEEESAWKKESEPESDIEAGSEAEAPEQPESQLASKEELDLEPETMVVQTSANGAQTLYVKDPITGEWVDPETNSVLDIEKHGDALDQLNKEQEWNNAEFEKISRGESEHDKALQESMKKIREVEKQENYKNILKSKYGTDNMKEIADIVTLRKERAAEWANIWLRNDKIIGVAEVGAVAVGTGADVAIDGLAVITPGGTKVRAGYKVLKGVAGTMAEAGAKGEDAVNWGNLAEGTIKGGADAGLDYIPGGGGVKTIVAKAGTTIMGESLGSAAGAALRGENVGEALSDGLKAGAYKATVNAITDAASGDLPNPVMSRGSFKAVPNMKNVIVSRAGGTKIGATLVDEYGIKPIIRE